jgi:hypothetical protein
MPPEEIAPAITIGIILADANVANLGKGLFEKAIKRLARETLEQEIERTIRTALRSAMRTQKRQLRQVKSFRALSKAEQTRILKDIEKQAELELYERLQKYAHRKADEYERAAAKVAAESDDQGRRSRELAVENAAAYREIEEACAQKTGSSVKSRPSDAEAKQPYDPHRAREEFEADLGHQSDVIVRGEQVHAPSTGTGKTRRGPEARQKIPGKSSLSLEQVHVPEAKFRDYIFKPGATHGKDHVFKSLGYGPEHSQELTDLYRKQAYERYLDGDYTLGKKDQYGQRIDIEIILEGVGDSAQKHSRLKSGWMVLEDGGIKLNTPFTGFKD